MEVVEETWLDNRSKIALQRSMSFLSHCITEDIYDNKLLPSVTLKTNFKGDEYLDSLDEIFQSKTEVELSLELLKHETKVMNSNLKKVCVITQNTIEITQKNTRQHRNKTTSAPQTRIEWGIDEMKVIDLYHDFQIEDFKQNIIKYINSVEEIALCTPVLSCTYTGNGLDNEHGLGGGGGKSGRKSLTGFDNQSVGSYVVCTCICCWYVGSVIYVVGV